MGSRLTVLCWCLCAAAVPSHAEIYKWVDANGQTHYSERKADAGAARAAQVKIASAPEVTQPSAAPTGNSRLPGKLTQPQPPAWPDKPTQPRVSEPPRDNKSPALSDGQDHGTDASRCALARDVLSGAVRHRNGKPTDTNDREVAKSDIKLFCRGK